MNVKSDVYNSSVAVLQKLNPGISSSQYTIHFLKSLWQSGIVKASLVLFLTVLPAFARPQFSYLNEKWLNGKPSALTNKPLILFIFTRGCGNCHRSHEFFNEQFKKYGEKVQFIGVHSPEFEWEKDLSKLKEYLREQEIEYPVYLDTDFKIWVSLDNHFWPAFIFFDAQGRRKDTIIGETHSGDVNAQKIESRLQSF
ncbi:MAG: redoxin domain-containing protein [Leptospiraceae bacterium]|nr:redoxin domain-containing protein [Leptospiraceae bacterium]